MGQPYVAGGAGGGNGVGTLLAASDSDRL